MIAIDLGKQQPLDTYLTAIQQFNFAENLDRAGNTTIFFIIKGAKETVRLFSRNCKSFVI